MTTCSTYEAKARFSEVLRMVRQGHSVAITYRGEPVAEIRPIDGQGGSALERRLAGFDRLLSSNLLEAEVRAALRREGRPSRHAP